LPIYSFCLRHFHISVRQGHCIPVHATSGEIIAMTRFSTTLKFAALSAGLLLGACTTKQQAAEAPPPPVQQAPAPARPAPVASSILPGSEQDFKVNVGDTVHFGYNEYSVQDTDKGTLSKQAAWLTRYPSVKLTVEGHADERGTREYNLALGARRANAVKEFLVAQGVAGGRLETVSYGKERPICTESNEDCWAQNRRGVSVVSGGANS
jgi:peptidoglycan-associated lipoprotein